MDGSSQSLALVVALLIDLVFCELPNRWHPVAWMGRSIAAWRRLTKTSGIAAPLIAGSLLVACGGAFWWAVGWQTESLSSGLPFLATAVVQGIVLKQTFSVRSLARAAGGVKVALQSRNLPAARAELSYHLVSRDVSTLNESQIAAATIESVAENASDSVVAPLFFFVVAGLPAALAYRFVNTCDAMLGYRTEELEWYGKAAARLDDLLNFVPARLTAGMILIVGGRRNRRPFTGVRVWLRDCRSTASPNAGHPMSAAAGALGVELEKVGQYCLGAGQPRPGAADIGRAVRMLWSVMVLATFLALGISALTGLLDKVGI
ncbi:adenosylcobinamide-phosphate synthase CbiB [Candidatus Laterigemmans baculatus]|uniref:adenosylcobinamide-phosphate synthase CbiB n=1 Tax=Candidatus Laterigemmans baculatus TaxID=2770505 RepID=UPI0013D92D1B|nr:adenosylcobinamide-phosphate synthase CbiB [Candidatus Laterigemmans baculatus]